MAQEVYEYAGYVFSSSEEMELAKKEAAGIQHINSKINYDDANGLLSIYNKLLERDLFTTVIGIDFLRNIRKILMEEYDYAADELKSIPVHLTGISQEEIKVNEQIKKAVNKSSDDKKSKKDKPSKVINISMLKPLIVAVAIAAILVVIVFLQFRVYSDSENLNILNYKERLERQYESWEEDLTERERVLNEQNLLK